MGTLHKSKLEFKIWKNEKLFNNHIAWNQGIGSKLMAKMGYVTGSGLGKFSEGRVEPVEATVLPEGKNICLKFIFIYFVLFSSIL